MAAGFGFGSAQTGNGRTIDVSSAANVHVVPNGEIHSIVVYCNMTAAGEATVKIDAETTGIVEACEAKKTRIIWSGTIVGGVSNSQVNVACNGAGRAWAEYRKLA